MPQFRRTAATGWAGGRQFENGTVEVVIDGNTYGGFSLITAQFPGSTKRTPSTACRASGLDYPAGTPIAFGMFPPEGRRVAVVYPQATAPVVIARAYLRRGQPIAPDCAAALLKLDAQDIPPDVADALSGGACQARAAAPSGSKPAPSTFTPDKWQRAALDAFATSDRHLMVIAGAGSGKSTFQRECILRLFQARAAGTAPRWAMKSSLKIGVFMFNRENRLETNARLKSTLPTVRGASASAWTFHAYGLSRITANWPGRDAVRIGKMEERDCKLDGIISEREKALCAACGLTEYTLAKVVVPAKELVHRARVFLTRYDDLPGLDNLIDKTPMQAIDLGGADRSRVVALAGQVLRWTLPEDGPRQFIDSADMLHWLATGQDGLDVEPFDLAFIDEAQDVGPDKLRISEMLAAQGARLCVVGDPAQAINLFTGALCDAMDRFADMLRATPRGLDTFDMPVNRRCSVAVVREANTVGHGWEKLVPRDAENSPNDPAPAGEVKHVSRSEMFHMVKPGDALISRVNSQCLAAALACLEAGLPFRVLGGGEAAREIVGVVEQATRHRCLPLSGESGLLACLERWLDKQRERLGSTPGMGMALSKLENHAQAINIIASRPHVNIRGQFYNLRTSADLIRVINALVIDQDGNKTHAVNIMSAHKSKGGEYQNVFNLTPDLFPHPRAEGEESIKQEYHLLGVVITRARLGYYVVDDWSPEEGADGDGPGNDGPGLDGDDDGGE